MSASRGSSDPQVRHDVFFSFHGSQRLYSDENGQVWNMRDCVVEKLASSELQRYWVTRNIGNLSIFYDSNDTKERLDEIWEGLLKTRGGGVVAVLASKDYFDQAWCLAELLAAKSLYNCSDEKERIRLCFIAVGMTVKQLKENWFMKMHATDLLTGNNAAHVYEISLPEAIGGSEINRAVNNLVNSVAKTIVELGSSSSLAVGSGQEESFHVMLEVVHRGYDEGSADYSALLLKFKVQENQNVLSVMGRDMHGTPQQLKTFLTSRGPSDATDASIKALDAYERKWLSDWTRRDWSICKNELVDCLKQAESLLKLRPKTYSDAQDVVPASDASDCSSIRIDGSAGFVGVDFTRRPMKLDQSWNVNVKESGEWLENLLSQLVEFGSNHFGLPSLYIKRMKCGDISKTRIVVKLSCKIRLRDNLYDFELDDVRAICKSLALLLECCGATPEEINDYMIGSIWRGSLCMILEVHDRIVGGLFAKISQANWSLPMGYKDIMVTGLSPVFTITMPHFVEIKSLNGRGVPDVWLIEEDRAQFLLPTSDAARSCIMQGGKKLSEFCIKDTVHDALKSLPTFRPTEGNMHVSWHSIQQESTSVGHFLPSLPTCSENSEGQSAKPSGGRTPLHDASSRGHLLDAVDVLSASQKATPNVSRERHENMEKDAEVNAKSNGGYTPLHDASHNGNESIASVMLDNGANVNAKDKDGWTPLHYASDKGHKAVVSLLLEKGADPTITDKNGKTPLQLAQEENKQNCVAVLEEFAQQQQGKKRLESPKVKAQQETKKRHQPQEEVASAKKKKDGSMELELAERGIYNQALAEGNTTLGRIGLTMCGPYGVGKTSIVRSLRGEPFNDEYNSTEGIAVGYVDKHTLGNGLDFEALEDDEDGIDSMEIGASDDEEEIEIPPFLSYVTTWRFWCKFAMWPVAFIVVNVISFSTLLVFDKREYSFNVPQRCTAHSFAMFQTNSAMSAIILLTDLAILLKAAIYMEKEMVALNAVEEDTSAAGHHTKHLHAQVSRKMDYFLQKRRHPHVSFFVSLLYFASVLCGAGFLSCVGLRAYSSSNKMQRDCAIVDPGKQKSNKPIDGLPGELQEWAKRWKEQSDFMHSTFIRLDDGRIFFQGFEAMMANETDEGGSYEDDVINYGSWDNRATLVSVVKNGMIENHPKVLEPRYFTSVNGKSDTDSKTFCCSYEEMIDKRQDMSFSRGDVRVPHKLLCVASGEDISNGFRNVSLPTKWKNGGGRANVEAKVKALNGVLYFEYTLYEHDHWSYHKIFAQMEIYKLQPDTMSLESIAYITGEESMGTVVSGIGSGDTCKTWIKMIICILASIVVFPASYWLLVIKEIPSGMAPAVVMVFEILADLANDDFAIALGFVTAIAASIYLLGIVKLPGRFNRETLVWVFYVIICYFTMYGLFHGPSTYGPRLEVPWWSFLVLSSIVGVLLNHPVLQLMGWIGGTTFVCLGLLFFVGYRIDNEPWIMVPAGLVIGCGLVTLGHALTKYRAYVVYYAKNLWRSAANVANAGRGDDDISTGLLSHRDV